MFKDHKEHFYLADTILWCFVATASLIGAIRSNNVWLIIPVAISEAKLGLVAHEACHRVNGAWPVLQLLYDCALGSRQMWIANHNRGHHVFTNTAQDPDMQASPILRLLPEQPLYWFHAHQWWYQYALFAALPVSLRINGLVHLHTRCGSKEIIKHYIVSLPATVLYIVWPCSLYGVWGLRFFFASNAILGLIYGTLFSVSHVNDRVLRGEEAAKGATHAERQMRTTADWAPGSYWWNYWTGGLNHQVIHHLKPGVSSYEFPEMAARMIGVEHEYRTFPNLLEAIRSNARIMHELGTRSNCKIV